MLRGLDIRDGRGDPAPVIRVAGRATVDGGVTAFVDASAPDADARRARLRTEFDRLEAAGVVADATVTTWQDADVAARYEEYVDAVGASALESHFEALAGGDALDVPPVCIEVRDEAGDLTGLFPRRVDAEEATVEDGLRALRTGEGVENVESDPELSVEPVDDGDDETADESAGEEADASGRVAKAD